MKGTCIFLLVLLSMSSVLADKSKLQSSVAAKLAMQSSANGAVESVDQLLKDLVQANNDEQAQAEADRIVWEAASLQEISDLTDIRNEFQRILNNQFDHQTFLKTEYQDTLDYIQWIADRLSEIERKKEELSDARCYANALFVKALKEHKDAQHVIVFLKADLGSCSSQPVTLSQIANIQDKLAAYSHLFNDQAVKDFIQLSRETYEDNDQGEIVIQDFHSGTADRNLSGSLCDKILGMLDQLSNHFAESMEDMETHEIEAAYDFAEWLQASEDEVTGLNGEHDRKFAYKAKLEIDLAVAQEAVDRATNDLNDSQAALDEAIAHLGRKRDWFASETERRHGENATLEDVIAIFEAQVGSMADYLKGRVDDYVPDQSFDKTELHSRKIDQQYSYDNENLAANVAAEAA